MEQSNIIVTELTAKWKNIKIKVVGNHPHTGAIATFQRFDRARALQKIGMVFKRDDTGTEFFVFDGSNIEIETVQHIPLSQKKLLLKGFKP
jgi:hypothetical protein